MPDKVGQQIGNYRLVRLLGSGGFADVYLGQHVYIASKQAAVKMLKLFDVDVQRFKEEAETTEKLVHPRIVRLFDFDLEQGIPFLVLDYAPGGALRARHPRGSQLPLDTVVGYLKEITPALQYAHDQNTLHRDIKPENILIGRGGELLLTDFGIAVLSQTGRTSLQNYTVGGTPFYMAPEQYGAKPEKASDQYSLAVVVYEWLCGTVPFREGNFIQLGYQHTHEPVPPMREKIPSIPSAVEEVVMIALAKDPHQRFGSVQAFATAFEQACIPPAQEAPSVTEPARPQSIPDTPAVQAPQEKVVSQQGVRPGSNRPLLLRRLQPIIQVLANPRNMLLLALVMFVILAGVIAAVGINQSSQASADATAVAIRNQMTATAVADSMANANATATDIAATATAQVNATPTAEANPYGGGGTLALNDPLSDNSLGNRWNESTHQFGTCAFTGGAYHVSSNSGIYCDASPDFINFAFEVQMTIIKGDDGGIDFRLDNTHNTYYAFFVGQDGTYELDRDQGTTTTQILVKLASSSAIHQGLGQTNSIAVVAQGSTITLYVNQQQIASVTDNTYTHGQLGFLAAPKATNGNPTEVAYSNAKLWTF